MHNYVKQSISSLAGKFLSFLSLYTFWEKCVYFSIFNDELCFVWHNCAFLSFKNWKINTLSSKNVQTEKAEESLIWTEREERKTKYFPPDASSVIKSNPKKQRFSLCLGINLFINKSVSSTSNFHNWWPMGIWKLWYQEHTTLSWILLTHPLT